MVRKVFLFLFLASCSDGYVPFDPGDVVHFKLDGKRGVVIECDYHKCNVQLSSRTWDRELWRVSHIEEDPKPRRVR